ISRDEIKEGYVNTRGGSHDELPSDTNSLVSDLFFEIVNKYLAGDISVVIEAAFQHEVWKSRMQALGGLASQFIVLCNVDSDLAARRHLERAREDSKREFNHGDRRVAHFRETGELLPPDSYEAPKLDVPTLEVSTDGEYVPGIDVVVEQITLQTVGAGNSPARLRGRPGLRFTAGDAQ